MDAALAAGAASGFAALAQMPMHESIAADSGLRMLHAVGGGGNGGGSGNFTMQGNAPSSELLPADLSLELALGLGAPQFGSGSGNYGHDTLEFGSNTLEDFSGGLSATTATGEVLQQPEKASVINSDGKNGNGNGNGSTKSLTTLINEVDGMDERLACGSWAAHAGACNSSIDNYPVGWVLSLVQDYHAILCRMQLPSVPTQSAPAAALALADQSHQHWSRSCKKAQRCDHHIPTAHSTSPMLGAMYHSQHPPSTMSSSSSRQSSRSTDSRIMLSASSIERHADSTADLSDILLLLSAYIQLTRLLSLVFSQFETYLRNLQTSRPLSHFGTGTGANRFQQHGKGLQLGQLPSTHETCSKIYTAVQLLLHALQSVEESAGLPVGARIRRTGIISHASSPDRTPSTSPPREGCTLLFELDVANSLLRQDPGGKYIRGNCPEVDELAARVKSVQVMLREMMK
jgi:hypothetical protein